MMDWQMLCCCFRCGICPTADGNGVDDGNHEQEEDVPDEEDYYVDEEDDELMEPSGYDRNRANIDNFGSPKLGGLSNLRQSTGSSHSSAARFKQMRGGKTKRPLSRSL